MRKTWLLMLVAVIALAVGVPAFADTVCSPMSPASAGIVIPNSGSCVIYLTQSNVIQLAGVSVKVTITNSSTTAPTTVSFLLIKNPLTNSAGGINQIGWNGGSSYSAVSVNDPTHSFTSLPTLLSKPTSMDHFGNFSVQSQAGGAPKAGVNGNTLTFTLAGHVQTFLTNSTGNSTGNLFAMQIRFGGSCSGWIGGYAGSTAPVSETACIPAGQVPEPGTMVMFGSGLFALAGVLRRRLL